MSDGSSKLFFLTPTLQKTGELTVYDLLRRFERGDFDLVAVGRALLQDPEWVQKIRRNQFDQLQNFEAANLGVYY